MAELDLAQLRIDRSTPASRVRLFGGRRRWLLAVGLVLLVAVLVMGRMRAGRQVDTVTVGTAYPYQAVTVLNAAGYVVAQRKAAIASKATGRLEWLGVREGSVVKANEIIARLESRDVGAQAEQAKANILVARAGVAQAQAEAQDAAVSAQRSRDLVAKKFLSQSALDTAEARLAKAKAAVASAQAALAAAEASARAADVALDQTNIRAPFDAVVLTKAANVGDTVTPFSAATDTKGAVVTVADMSTLEVEADVAESSLAKIKVGQPCEIQLDAFPDKRFRGEVSRLVPTVDRSKATVLTKVRFIDQDGDGAILPEMSAKVAFLSAAVAEDQRKPLTVVSPEAVISREGKSLLFTIVDGKAKAVEVQTGVKLGETVAVTGIKAGERVILKPDADLKDGSLVKLVEKK